MSIEPVSRKAQLAEIFDRSASDYADIGYFPIHAARLLETARPAPGARLLDVACGRGAVLFPAARRVGPAGEAVGIDLSPAMIRETEAERARRGLANVRLVAMDAEALDFPDASFDVVTCAFALFFFPRLEVALAEIRRVLRPGGRLVASTWGDDDPAWEWYNALRSRFGAVVGLKVRALDRLADLEGTLRAAGFADVAGFTARVDYVYPNAAAFWQMAWSTSGRAGLEKLEPIRLAELRDEILRGLASRRREDGLHELQEVHFASGSRR